MKTYEILKEIRVCALSFLFLSTFFPSRGEGTAKSSRFQRTAVVERKVIEEKKVFNQTRALTVESSAVRKWILKIASDEFLGPSDKAQSIKVQSLDKIPHGAWPRVQPSFTCLPLCRANTPRLTPAER